MNRKKTVLLAIGTRPEAIKMCPLIHALKNHNSFKTVICLSGQHKEMLAQAIGSCEVEVDYDLAIMQPGQTLTDITVNLMKELPAVLDETKPDCVLVHGDTTTSYCTAVASFYKQIPIGHVEAGLRTRNMYSPFPEEFNRQAIGLLAKYHFAPTGQAAQNLLDEKKDPEHIYITGNTIVDVVNMNIQDDFTHPLLEMAEGKRIILVTAHRRENLGAPMEEMFLAIRDIIDAFEDTIALFPVHINPVVREIADKILSDNPRILMCEPLNMIEFHNILSRSCIVLTDSGGIQEEAPSFGKPVLVMRDTTERPEAIEAGTARLVGTSRQKIVSTASLLLSDKDEYDKMSVAQNPFGDGHASERIVEILAAQL